MSDNDIAKIAKAMNSVTEAYKEWSKEIGEFNQHPIPMDGNDLKWLQGFVDRVEMQYGKFVEELEKMETASEKNGQSLLASAEIDFNAVKEYMESFKNYAYIGSSTYTQIRIATDALKAGMKKRNIRAVVDFIDDVKEERYRLPF